MSRSLNKVMLIGNLGSDPEVRSTTGGNRVANFSLATTRQWNSPSGEKQEKTEWHKCIVWNSKGTGWPTSSKNIARRATDLRRGTHRVPPWADKENHTRYSTRSTCASC